jgi:hypothetical protein
LDYWCSAEVYRANKSHYIRGVASVYTVSLLCTHKRASSIPTRMYIIIYYIMIIRVDKMTIICAFYCLGPSWLYCIDWVILDDDFWWDVPYSDLLLRLATLTCYPHLLPPPSAGVVWLIYNDVSFELYVWCADDIAMVHSPDEGRWVPLSGWQGLPPKCEWPHYILSSSGLLCTNIQRSIVATITALYLGVRP